MPLKTDVTTLTTKGQITIPKKIRKYLGIKPKDRIKFEVEEGVVKIRPAKDLDLNFGRVKPPKKPEDFKKIRKLFEEKVGEELGKKI